MTKMTCFLIWENVSGAVAHNENNVLCDFICYKDNSMMGDDSIHSFFLFKILLKMSNYLLLSFKKQYGKCSVDDVTITLAKVISGTYL